MSCRDYDSQAEARGLIEADVTHRVHASTNVASCATGLAGWVHRGYILLSIIGMPVPTIPMP